MPQDEVYAVISTGRLRLRLPVGDVVTVGRSAETDVQIGHVPVDRRVPRKAVRLECRPDGVLIVNTSDKRTITAEVWPGPGFEVPPLSMAGTAPHSTVTLVIHGTDGVRHAVTVDSSRLAGAGADPATGDDHADDGNRTVGYEPLTDLSERQHQMLCALLLPGRFGWRDLTSTPTYAQMAEILAERRITLSTSYIRNTLDELRLTTALVHDVYDVHGDGPCNAAVPPSSYLPNLARWVRLSGTVTDAHLTAFDALTR